MATDTLTDRIVERAVQLLAVPAVVGFERPLLDHLAIQLLALDRGVSRTEHIVVAEGRDGAPTLTAHIDRHGLVCTSPGTLAYAAHAVPAQRGMEVHPRHSFAQVVCSRFADEAVRAYDPETGATIAEGVVPHTSVCGIDDLGVEVPARGLDDVALGTPVAFAESCHARGDKVSGQLDNALTAAVALVAVERGFTGTVAFSAEEEIGGSWRHLAAALPRGPRRSLVVLDTSPFPDDAPAAPGTVVLRRRDAAAAFDEDMVERLAGAAASVGAAVVYKDAEIERRNAERASQGLAPLGLGRTELGRLVAETDGRLTGATLQVPTTGYHTNGETTDRASLAAVAETLLTVLECA